MNQVLAKAPKREMVRVKCVCVCMCVCRCVNVCETVNTTFPSFETDLKKTHLKHLHRSSPDCKVWANSNEDNSRRAYLSKLIMKCVWGVGET